MRLSALLLLAAALAACGTKPSAAPVPPTPEALGAELATFPQLLVPISTSTWSLMLDAGSKKDPQGAKATWHTNPYAHVSLSIDGKHAEALIAYTGVWLAPRPAPLQPMSVQQYLQAFAADAGTDLAIVVAPKGTFYITRTQLVDVMQAASAAGAGLVDLPYSIILSSTN